MFAGTGDKGVIYKIAPDGKGAPFYKTKATHATALAFDKAGNLLVGTGSPGTVLRVDADGKAFVLLDSPFQEIRALRFDDKGMLYVAALSGRPAAAAARPALTDDRRRPARRRPDRARRSPSVSAEITSIVDRRRRRQPVDGIAARGSRGRQRAPSTASLPTASGISSGNRATTRRTT